MKPIIQQIQTKINLNFNNPSILEEALTHKSYLNENRSTLKKSYERLEFLGDAVLEFWISDFLYTNFPDFPEGKLTNLRALSVCTKNLSQVAREIDIPKYIILSQGEDRGGGRQNDSILEDIFEALVGAIYLDQGQNQAFDFLNQYLLPQVKKLSKKKIYKDPKSILQEITQATINITPRYQVLKESGPDHMKIFKVAVVLGDKQIATGIGRSKQQAEEKASVKAIKILKTTNKTL